MKIALYLGFFNPFHNGHLECIKTALNDFKMDRVIIVPTMRNPSKEEKVLDINKRIEIINTIMLNKFQYKYTDDDNYHFLNDSIEKLVKVSCSAIEKELIPPYHSYATLHALKNKYCNDEIFVLCGEDTIKDIPNWMHGGKIIEDYNFLVIDRSKNSISSSYIRDTVKRGGTINECVSLNVIDLIKKYYE